MASENKTSIPKVVMYLMYLMAGAISFLAAQYLKKESQYSKCIIERSDERDSMRDYYNGIMVHDLQEKLHESDSIIKSLQNKK